MNSISSMEDRLPADWWKTLFNETYLKTDGDVVENNENTSQDIDLLLDLTKISQEHSILDLCCGQGRHCMELYKRGYKNIIGLDYSTYLLNLALKRSSENNMNISFVRGDVRNPPFEEKSFDAVICMGNSFGYFHDEREDCLLIQVIHKLLKPGGLLFLDLSNGELVKNSFQKQSEEQLDEKTIVRRERSLNSTGRRLITREMVCSSENGVEIDQFYAETLYSSSEIKEILEKIGFISIQEHTSCSVTSTRNQDLGMLSHRMLLSGIKK